MKQDEKKVYVSPGVSIQNFREDDVISTSGFLGGDDGIYTPSNSQTDSTPGLYPYSIDSHYNINSGK